MAAVHDCVLSFICKSITVLHSECSVCKVDKMDVSLLSQINWMLFEPAFWQQCYNLYEFFCQLIYENIQCLQYCWKKVIEFLSWVTVIVECEMGRPARSKPVSETKGKRFDIC